MDPITLGLIAGGGALMSAFSGFSQSKAQEAMHKYNAQVAENEALAQQYAVDAERQKLTDAQRGVKATQRMSVASRGGLMAGTDLSTLANEAAEMQLDQLELMRQSDIAALRGKSAAAMERYKAKGAKAAGKWTIAYSLMDGVTTYAKMGGIFGKSKETMGGYKPL